MMEESASSKAKNKRPRVLANTIKKPEKNLNSSGNKSFSKRSSYIQDLRANNAKLAHSLANERLKYGEITRRYIEREKLHLHQEAEFRNISRNMRTGVKFINDSVDMMCQGISLLTDVSAKLNCLWPEPKETLLSQTPAVNVNLPSTSTQPSVHQVADQSHAASQTVASPRTNVPSPRHYTAMPMVQGQVISKPIISLERVNVPVGFGKKPRLQLQPPTKPQDILQLNRLSIVSEEMNVSREDAGNISLISSPSNHSLAMPSGSLATNSLPASHVVLERIATDHRLTLDDDDDDEVDQQTTVCFGSMRFSFEKPASPNKSPPHSKSLTERRLNASSALDSSKSNSNSPGSDEYETESSSDDDELALQIVESKKSFTERKRQTDSREGTSWNYDDAGKYHGRPPKRKTAKCFSSSEKAALSKSESIEHRNGNMSGPRELRTRVSLEKVTSPKSHVEDPTCSKQAILTGNGETVKSLEKTHSMDTTCVEDMDMSLTCVTAVRKPFVLGLDHSEASPERAEAPSKLTEQQQNSERKVFVTQRPRGRKHLPESSDSPTSRHSSFSPLSNRNSQSTKENNENSPPSLVVAAREEICSVGNFSDNLSHLPNVVLERLPSSVISGSMYLPNSSDFTIHNSLKSLDSHSSQTKSRFKCLLGNSATGSSECNTKSVHEESKDSRSNSKPRTKEKKKLTEPPMSPKALRNENPGANKVTELKRSLSPDERSSASPSRKSKRSEMEDLSSNGTKAKKKNSKSRGNSEDSRSSGRSLASVVSDDGDGHERPRRHAAPTNLKEPKCNIKMRRN